MNTLLRPALYGAVHPLKPLTEGASGPGEVVDVVGPICESSDVFERDVTLPRPRAGELIAFTNAGAYGAVMASDYNSRGMPGEVLVEGARTAVIKPPRPPATLFTDETVPDWLATAAAAGH